MLQWSNFFSETDLPNCDVKPGNDSYGAVQLKAAAERVRTQSDSTAPTGWMTVVVASLVNLVLTRLFSFSAPHRAPV
jgi:hypothetical protein